MRIYRNDKELRFFTGLVRGVAAGMLFHAVDNLREDEKKKKELGEEKFIELCQYDWRGNNIRPEAIFTCRRILSKFLDTCISHEQKKVIETMSDDEKCDFGHCLYNALFRTPLALDKEYQQAIKAFPETDVTPNVEIGKDGKAGIVFA